jgi:hypothetical protein
LNISLLQNIFYRKMAGFGDLIINDILACPHSSFPSEKLKQETEGIRCKRKAKDEEQKHLEHLEDFLIFRKKEVKLKAPGIGESGSRKNVYQHGPIPGEKK